MGIETDGFLVGGNRLVEFVQFAMDVAKTFMPPRIVRFELKHSLEAFHGAGPVLIAKQSRAQIQLSGDVARIDADRLPVGGDRPGRILLSLQSEPQVEMNKGVGRIEADRQPRFRRGAVKIAKVVESSGQGAVRG